MLSVFQPKACMHFYIQLSMKLFKRNVFVRAYFTSLSKFHNFWNSFPLPLVLYSTVINHVTMKCVMNTGLDAPQAREMELRSPMEEQPTFDVAGSQGGFENPMYGATVSIS